MFVLLCYTKYCVMLLCDVLCLLVAFCLFIIHASCYDCRVETRFSWQVLHICYDRESFVEPINKKGLTNSTKLLEV